MRWQPGNSGDRVEVDRVHFASVVKIDTKSAKQLSPGPAGKEPALVRLRASPEAEGDSLFRPDAGGMIDPGARRGESFVYTAQRVRQVVLDGRMLELRSAVSAPVTVVMRDKFPPQAPSGVEATASWVAGAPGVDLSWRPNTEDDLAGYLVYRVDVDSGAGNVRVTPAPFLQPAFHDVAVAAGHTYWYTVTAIDAAGNQSQPSAPAEEKVLGP